MKKWKENKLTTEITEITGYISAYALLNTKIIIIIFKYNNFTIYASITSDIHSLSSLNAISHVMSSLRYLFSRSTAGTR